jgi:hypothetical protein
MFLKEYINCIPCEFRIFLSYLPTLERVKYQINCTVLLWLYSPSLDLGRFFSFLIYTQSVGLLGRRISSSQGRYLTQTQHKRTQTSMPRLGFESTTPMFERAKTVRALDCAATVIAHYAKWACWKTFPQSAVIRNNRSTSDIRKRLLLV